MHVRTMAKAECVKVLAGNRLVRLACVHDGRPYIVPIHVVREETHFYAFSMPGQKIEWMRCNPHVCVQVEEHGGVRGWKSVVADGLYEELNDLPEHERLRDHAWSLLSQYANWWEPGSLKPVASEVSDHSSHVFFRIRIEGMTGREAVEDDAQAAPNASGSRPASPFSKATRWLTGRRL